jgi:hypothetical protein
VIDIGVTLKHTTHTLEQQWLIRVVK